MHQRSILIELLSARNLLAVLLTLVVSFNGMLYAEDQSQSWKPIADDLENLEIESSFLFGTDITLVRTSLKRFQPIVIRAKDFGFKRSSVQHLVKQRKAVVGINANFFDESGEPLGLVVNSGIPINPLHTGGKTLTGIFLYGRGIMSIIHRRDFSARAVLLGIQAGPRLIIDGKPSDQIRSTKTSTKRSGICIDNKNRLIFYVARASFWGISLKDLQTILVREDIGCYQSLNLDGGGSSQMIVTNNVPGASKDFPGIFIEGDDDVPIVLGLVPTE